MSGVHLFIVKPLDANGKITEVGDTVQIDGRVGTVLGYTDTGLVIDFGGKVESVEVYD